MRELGQLLILYLPDEVNILFCSDCIDFSMMHGLLQFSFIFTWYDLLNVQRGLALIHV